MEQWKPIPGYEGLYDASNLGNIRSTPGKVTSNARYDKRVWKTRIIRQKWTSRKCGKKDARVCLWKDGKEKTYLVSRLIALTWCDGYEDGLTVNHIDGNTENNVPSNLEWVSRADNIRHAFYNGFCASFQKPVLLVDPDGMEHAFCSLSAASRYLGRDSKYVSGVLRDNRLYAYSDEKRPYSVVRS